MRDGASVDVGGRRLNGDDNLLRHHVVEQSLQSLLDALLVVQRAPQQVTFKLLVHKGQCGTAGAEAHAGILEVERAASVQVFLTLLPLDDRITEANHFVDQVVDDGKRVDL